MPWIVGYPGTRQSAAVPQELYMSFLFTDMEGRPMTPEQVVEYALAGEMAD